MKARFLELLARHEALASSAIGEMEKKADAVTADLAALLSGLDSRVRTSALELIMQDVADRMATSPTGANAQGTGKLTPELLQWARQTFDEEQFMAGLREIRETGGLEFEDFVAELERAAGEHE